MGIENRHSLEWFEIRTGDQEIAVFHVGAASLASAQISTKEHLMQNPVLGIEPGADQDVQVLSDEQHELYAVLEPGLPRDNQGSIVSLKGFSQDLSFVRGDIWSRR